MNRQKSFFSKWLFLILFGILLTFSSALAATEAKPDPETDGLTYTLPDNASPVRLSLPATIDDLFYSSKTGLVGFGLHAGGHLEGLDHVWIELKPGTAVKSWAAGTINDVYDNGGEYFIEINYGHKLVGTHMEIMTPYVSKGQKVKRGQEVGLGMSYDTDQSSAEFQLADGNRTDGVYNGNSYLVSPYDYLRPKAKTKLIKAYKNHMLKPYLQTGADPSILFEPYEYKLTNKIDLAKRKENKINGVWYSLKKWKYGYPNDILTFVTANNKYFKGTKVMANDDEELSNNADWYINGRAKINYKKNRLTITNTENNRIYYGIFKIKDWKGGRQKLIIEYQEGFYPTKFTTNALKYASRSNLQRRADAVKLGVRKTL
ncbi:MAG: M23 family metallopeptidase [Patescibacteria group bacterium]|nr:M23 family metallopeptidase [Patescibacteria group bacterium]